MIFLWPAAAQQAIVTVAGPTQLSLPSTVLLTPGHHVLVGFAFWNAGAAPVDGRHFHGRELPALFSALDCQRASGCGARSESSFPAITLHFP